MPELHWHSRSIGSFNFLDERRWQLRLAMARVRSQRQIIINGYRRNLKLEAWRFKLCSTYRIAQIPPLSPDSSGMRSQFATLSAAVHCSHNTNTWSPFPIHTEKKRRKDAPQLKTNWISYLDNNTLCLRRTCKVWTTRSAPNWEEWLLLCSGPGRPLRPHWVSCRRWRSDLKYYFQVAQAI